MMRVYFITLFLLQAIIPAQAQSYKSWYNRAEKLFNLENPTRRSDSLAEQLYVDASIPALQNRDGKIAVSSLIRAAAIRQTYKQFKEAAELYHRSLVANYTYFSDTAMLYEACLYLGAVFYQQGITDSAKYYFEKSSLLTSLYSGNETFPEQERLHNSLGAIYYESANYNQAVNYFQKALQFDDDEETRITLQSNIANCLVQLNRYDEGIKLFNSLLPGDHLTRIILHNIAHAYTKIGKFDSAVKYFSKVTRQHDEVTVRMLIDLGKIYSASEDYHQAVKALDSSLHINNNLSGNIQNIDRASNYLVRSQMAVQQHQSIEAMKWCDSAVDELMIEGPASEVNTVSPLLMIDVLKQKASLLEAQYLETRSSAYLEKCFSTWLQAIHVATYIRRYLDNDEAKMYFQQHKGEIFHEALRVGFAWMDKKNDKALLNTLISVMEAYKGNILFENIQQATFKAASKIPEAIRQKEQILKQSISYYTVKLGTTSSSQQATNLQKNILSARVELSRLQKQYEFHPGYDFYKPDTLTIDYRERLTAALDRNSALLCFTQANDNIYALAITKNSFQTFTIKVSPQLKKDFETFRSEIYHHTEGKRYEGAQASMSLYRNFIKPFESTLAGIRKLVILPDGLLNYVPFGALVAGNDPRDYLLRHKEVSYHYSISLLLFNYEHPGSIATGNADLFLAPFAVEPTYHTASLSLLPFSESEGPDKKVLKWVGDRATKKNLLEKIGSSRIVHLATHAKSGDGKGGETLIYLYPADSSAEANNLYLEEIYSLDLSNTELIILSACETADGVNAAGEGLLSLSRAFMYAGSKGIISTLWKTEDQVSSKLMQFFYAEMDEGYPAEEALQNAKIRFLDDESISEKYKTPNYWSNFIYVGQTGKRSGHAKATWLYLAAALAITIAIVYIVLKKRKLSRHSRIASVVEP